jgi:spore coat protein U-like protein
MYREKIVYQKTYFFLNPIFFVNRGTYTMIRRFVLASAILIAVGSAAPAMASTASTDLTVQADVIAGCTISTNPMSFGNYDPISSHLFTDLEASGTVTTTCSNGLSASITLGQGGNADPGSDNDNPLRRLSNNASTPAFLDYRLYQNPGRSVVWGNSTNSDAEIQGTGSAQDITIYGTIPGGQPASSGSYSDTVVATVTF